MQCRNINRPFVKSFKVGENALTKNFFNIYYMPLVEIKDYNALLKNKPFFDQPIRNKQEAHGKQQETC